MINTFLTRIFWTKNAVIFLSQIDNAFFIMRHDC